MATKTEIERKYPTLPSSGPDSGATPMIASARFRAVSGRVATMHPSRRQRSADAERDDGMYQKRRLAALLLAGTAATAVGLSGAGTAQAATEYAYLTIRSLGGGQYSVTVTGHLNLPVAVPTDYSIKIIGEDTWFDEPPVCEQYSLTTNEYGNFWHQYTCPGTLLNEDVGQDENYAKVTVYPAGVRAHSVRSNTVEGYY
jgi:hypothetical protein